jgi:hypothetical protein
MTASGEMGAVDAWPFHVANLLMHWLNGYLVYRILRRIHFAQWPAVFGAIVFVVHPLQVEPVAWATGMKDLLSSACALGSIAVYLRAADAWKSDRPARAHLSYSLALLALFFGCLAKPGILGAALIAGLLDAVFVTGLAMVVFWRTLLLALVVLPSVVWTSIAQPVAPQPGTELILRPTVALHALGFYLQKIFVPSRLCVDYGLRPVVVVTQWRHLLVASLPILYLLALLLAKRHRQPIAVAGLIFVLGVAPVLGLVPFGFQFWSTVADRYVYLSMLGIAILAAYAIQLVPSRSCLLAAASIVLGLSAIAMRQVSAWKDTFSLMDHCLRINPSSAVARNNFAAAFCPTPQEELHLIGERNQSGPQDHEKFAALAQIGDDYFMQAFLLRPQYPEPLHNLIYNRAGRGQLTEAMQVVDLAGKIGARRTLERALPAFELGWLSMKTGRRAEARALFALILTGQPQHAGARGGLAELARVAASTAPTHVEE